MTIGIVVAGAGRWGPHLIRNFSSDLRSSVASVVELDPNRRAAIEQRFPGVHTTGDFDSAISMGDAVVVATPSESHYGLVKAALTAGKHVLVEKPLATRLDHAIELEALAQESGAKLMVGHVFLFNPAIRAAGDLIRNGDLGSLHYVSMLRTNLGPVRSDTNAAWDLASHDISIANDWIGATPASVTATGGMFINDGVEDVVFGTLRYDNGTLVHIHASWLNPRKSRFVTAVGSRQMLTVNDMDLSEPVRVYDKGVGGDEVSTVGVQDTFAQFRTEIRDGQVTIPLVSGGEPLAAECSSFLDRIGGDDTAISDGKTGVEVVRVLEAMDRSMELGSLEVEVDR